MIAYGECLHVVDGLELYPAIYRNFSVWLCKVSHSSDRVVEISHDRDSIEFVYPAAFLLVVESQLKGLCGKRIVKFVGEGGSFLGRMCLLDRLDLKLCGEERIVRIDEEFTIRRAKMSDGFTAGINWSLGTFLFYLYEKRRNKNPRKW